MGSSRCARKRGDLRVPGRQCPGQALHGGAGSPVVDHLFRRVPLDRLIVLAVGMTEVVSILVRKHNSGRLTGSTFQQALGEFRAEINTGAPIRVVGIVGVEAESAYDFVERHFVNSTDAILLRTALDLATALRARGDDLLLVTSDRRLLRAARAEGADSLRPGAAILR